MLMVTDNNDVIETNGFAIGRGKMDLDWSVYVCANVQLRTSKDGTLFIKPSHQCNLYTKQKKGVRKGIAKLKTIIKKKFKRNGEITYRRTRNSCEQRIQHMKRWATTQQKSLNETYKTKICLKCKVFLTTNANQ